MTDKAVRGMLLWLGNNERGLSWLGHGDVSKTRWMRTGRRTRSYGIFVRQESERSSPCLERLATTTSDEADFLIEKYEGLIRYAARQYAKYCTAVDMDDLVQEGFILLLRVFSRTDLLSQLHKERTFKKGLFLLLRSKVFDIEHDVFSEVPSNLPGPVDTGAPVECSDLVSDIRARLGNGVESRIFELMLSPEYFPGELPYPEDWTVFAARRLAINRRQVWMRTSYLRKIVLTIVKEKYPELLSAIGEVLVEKPEEEDSDEGGGSN